jgi:hypothetical protein
LRKGSQCGSVNAIVDIPSIPDQGQRLAEVAADCHNQAEELTAMEVYFTDATQFPFLAT